MLGPRRVCWTLFILIHAPRSLAGETLVAKRLLATPASCPVSPVTLSTVPYLMSHVSRVCSAL